jgi:NTE family protein
MLRGGLHWLISLISSGIALAPPKALLNNDPLWDLLKTSIDWPGVRTSISRGHLRALALCATSYETGQSVAFFDGVDDIQEWTRAQRVGRRTKLTLNHLMASSAIPMLFPPILLNNEYFGDGAMRQLNPLSPAVHLGADRLLIVGVRARRAAGVSVPRQRVLTPSPGQIFGYMLDTLFTDQIFGDLEQLERINQLVVAAPEAAPGLRCVETLMLAPSVDPREIAARHIAEMPAGLRSLLRVIGARDLSGSQLASYLMFERGYTCELIKLGYQDAIDAQDAIRAFMAGERPGIGAAAATPAVAQAT